MFQLAGIKKGLEKVQLKFDNDGLCLACRYKCLIAQYSAVRPLDSWFQRIIAELYRQMSIKRIRYINTIIHLFSYTAAALPEATRVYMPCYVWFTLKISLNSRSQSLSELQCHTTSQRVHYLLINDANLLHHLRCHNYLRGGQYLFVWTIHYIIIYGVASSRVDKPGLRSEMHTCIHVNLGEGKAWTISIWGRGGG